MAIIVNGTPYDTWDDVPQALRIAIANSGTGDPVAPEQPAEEVDELDELVRLAEAAEARRAGLEPDAPPPPPPAPPAEEVPTFELNGQVYRSLDDVPDEIREALRLQLLGPPAPILQPRVPAALDRVAPPAGSPMPTPSPGAGDGVASGYEPEPRASLWSQVSTKYKVAMLVMVLMIIAIYATIAAMG